MPQFDLCVMEAFCFKSMWYQVQGLETNEALILLS